MLQDYFSSTKCMFISYQLSQNQAIDTKHIITSIFSKKEKRPRSVLSSHQAFITSKKLYWRCSWGKGVL